MSKRRRPFKAPFGQRACFVTVGTTSFDDLVKEIDTDAFLSMVAATWGVAHTRLQIGKGAYTPLLGKHVDPRIGLGASKNEGEEVFDAADEGNASGGAHVEALSKELSTSRSTLEYYRFAPSLKADMEAADIVICHAGAGSIMEALRANKPLMVVVNEKLMDNHQWEIADAMKDGKHLLTSTPQTLLKVRFKAIDAHTYTNIAL